MVDIECDAKHLDKVMRMLKREIHSVNVTTKLPKEDEHQRPSLLSACPSFGKWMWW